MSNSFEQGFTIFGLMCNCKVVLDEGLLILDRILMYKTLDVQFQSSSRSQILRDLALVGVTCSCPAVSL